MDIKEAIDILKPKDLEIENLDLAHANSNHPMKDEAYNVCFSHEGPMEKYTDQPNMPDKLLQISRDLKNLQESGIITGDIEQEVCGNWLWISGDTKQNAAHLKKLGLRYARKKGKWYWRPAGYKKRGKRTYNMDEIREKYGSKEV